VRALTAIVAALLLAAPAAADQLDTHPALNTPSGHPVRDAGATPALPAGQRVGAFLLPNDAADTIVLDHDIEEAAWTDFERALKARPSAAKLLLDSDGGLVAEAIDIAREVAKRGITTLVPEKSGCYSACAYIFFAGRARHAEGELGVHQISGDDVDVESIQVTLSSLLDALHDFGVEEPVISAMLRTSPDDMYVFTPSEIEAWHVDRAETPPIAPEGAAVTGGLAQ
jgi:hypothetical protein